MIYFNYSEWTILFAKHCLHFPQFQCFQRYYIENRRLNSLFALSNIVKYGPCFMFSIVRLFTLFITPLPVTLLFILSGSPPGLWFMEGHWRLQDFGSGGGHFKGVGHRGGPGAEPPGRRTTFENLQKSLRKITKNYYLSIFFKIL